MLINHLLLIFKFYIKNAKNTKQLNFHNLKITIQKIKELEKELTSSNKLKILNKWRPIDHIIDWYFFQSQEGGVGGGRRLISSSLVYLFIYFFLFLFFVFVFSPLFVFL